MKIFLIQISIVCTFVVINSCRPIQTGTLDYNMLNYDTGRVALFLWDTTKYAFPNNSDPLPLTQDDLHVVDSFLQNAIDSFNVTRSPQLYLSFEKVAPIDSFRINPVRYKTQLFPYEDVNGERIILVIGFSNNFPNWKNEVYGRRLHSGIRDFRLKINLSQKFYADLEIGG